MKAFKFFPIYFLALVGSSCDEFLDIGAPNSELVRSTVFSLDETANRAILGVYSQFTSDNSFASGSIYSISFIASLSSDELLNHNAVFEKDLNQFNKNELLPS